MYGKRQLGLRSSLVVGTFETDHGEIKKKDCPVMIILYVESKEQNIIDKRKYLFFLVLKIEAKQLKKHNIMNFLKQK